MFLLRHDKMMCLNVQISWGELFSPEPTFANVMLVPSSAVSQGEKACELCKPSLMSKGWPIILIYPQKMPFVVTLVEQLQKSCKLFIGFLHVNYMKRGNTLSIV